MSPLKDKIKYLNFIGIILFVVILWKIDLKQIVHYLKTANYWYLILAYPFLLMLIFFKAIRWNVLMRSQNVKTSIFETFYVYLWAFYFGAVTPGRIGEISKAIYFQDKFDNLGRAFVSVAIDRGYDIGIRVAALFLLYPFFSHLFAFNYIGFLIIILSTVAGIVILKKFKSIHNIIARFSKFILPKKYYPVIQQNISGFINDTVMMLTSIRYVALSTLLTIPGFICYCLVAYLIQKSFSIEMPFGYTVFCLVLSSFSVAVPISVSGLGVREAIMIFLFKSIGLGSEAAVLFSLSIFALSPVLGFHGWLVNILMIIYGFLKKRAMNKSIPEDISD